MEITLASPCSVSGAGIGKFLAALPTREAVVTTSSSNVDLAFNRETSFRLRDSTRKERRTASEQVVFRRGKHRA